MNLFNYCIIISLDRKLPDNHLQFFDSLLIGETHRLRARLIKSIATRELICEHSKNEETGKVIRHAIVEHANKKGCSIRECDICMHKSDFAYLSFITIASLLQECKGMINNALEA